MALVQVVGTLPARVKLMMDRVKDPSPALDRAGSYLTSATIRRISKGEYAPNSPLTMATKGSSKPLMDRGLLRNSMTHRIEGGSIVVGSNHPAAGLLHSGGTITPKTAKTLLIPAGAKTRALQRVFGFSPRDVLEGLVGNGYRIIWRPKAVLAQGPKGKPMLIFIRKKSVTIPSRPFMLPDTKDIQVVGNMIVNYIAGYIN